RTRSKKPLSARRSPGAKLPSTAHLASWSATTIAAAVANQRQFLGIQPFFAGSVQVAAAAAAERLVVDVRAVMPAALAFAVRARQRVPGLEEHAVVALSGKYLPEFLGGEGQDRRHQPHQAVGDVVERGLRRATGKRVGLARVEPVLEDVEEERAEVLGAERLQ